MTIGIIREGKQPQDNRVPLSPDQCKTLMADYPNVDILVQPSSIRCYTDQEYERKGIPVQEDLTDCDVLLGVKEVPTAMLIPDKTYMFFSHTIKKQPQNRQLLQTILKKNIRLIDYELLKDQKDRRVIAFGWFAGVVGAHNGLMTWADKTGSFQLPRAYTFRDLRDLKDYYKTVKVPPLKILLTGGGRVAQGAREVLDWLRIKRLSKEEFLAVDQPDEPVYVQLQSADLYEPVDDKRFELADFYRNPRAFTCTFQPFYASTDLMINAIYWEPHAPRFFTREEMKRKDFRIHTIADITCDIEGAIPATYRATTIKEPVMGYDPANERLTELYQQDTVDIMAVDNLPNELPRDASSTFGQQLIDIVLPALLEGNSDMIRNATIAQNGSLTPAFSYLQDFVDGKE